MRINKYIGESGYCSRREADRLVDACRVTVNGKPATIGIDVTDADHIEIDGVPIAKRKKDVYLALNKPVGITCTTDQAIEGNIVDFIGYPERIFHIGRLDKDSQGLILMTNDGDIVNKILREENNHEKEYIVRIDQQITPDFLVGMASGVEILGTVTKPCKVTQVNQRTFRITLTQGMNRQIRRMCKEFGCRVEKLERVRIMNIELGNLPVGGWRDLTAEELKELRSLL